MCLATNSIDNTYGHLNGIIFTINGTKLYVPVVTLLAKGNQKLSKLSQKSERSVYWNKYKAKNEKGNATNEYRYFLELDFAEVNRCIETKMTAWKDIKR